MHTFCRNDLMNLPADIHCLLNQSTVFSLAKQFATLTKEDVTEDLVQVRLGELRQHRICFWMFLLLLELDENLVNQVTW